MANEIYMTHYIKQSFGWVKIAEYAFKSKEDARRMEQEIRAKYPNDTARFDFRD